MAIKFEKIQAGMVLFDRHTYRMGNTTIRTIGEWKVKILSVDPVKRTAEVSWNHNSPSRYYESDLRKLYDWSMHDADVEVTYGIWNSVTKVKRKKAVKP